MKYTKIALLGLMCASLFSSCGEEKDPNYGPGTATVYFTELENGAEPATPSITKTVNETDGLFTIPVRYKGEPGGFPVIVKVKAEVSGVDNINDVAIITTTTIRITESNNSFIQIDPVNQYNSVDDYTVKLTIESAKGANIGMTKECNIEIKNIEAVRYGQYNFSSLAADPDSWTMILREGPDGEYIAQNIFGYAYTPRLLGKYDSATKKLVFNGRAAVGSASGQASIFGTLSQFMFDGFQIALMSTSGELVFNVSNNMELTSMTGDLLMQLYTTEGVHHSDVAMFRTGGKLEYAGEVPKEDWPFEE